MKCTSNYCTLDRLDLKRYQTKHMQNCSDSIICPEIVLELTSWTELLDIVEKEQVPLITVTSSDNGLNPLIEVTSSEDNQAPARVYSEEGVSKTKDDDKASFTAVKSYVCISHV